MRKRILCFLLAVLLCGCTSPSDHIEGGRAVHTVYCTTSDALLAPQEVALGVLERDAEIRRLFSVLCELQLSKFCDTLRLETFSLVEDTLTLDLSGGYDSISGLSRTLCDGAITLTFCELPYVNTVVLRTNGAESQPLTADSFLLSLPMYSSQREVRFYFAENRVLSAETRILPDQSEEDFLKSVTETLLLGPQSKTLTSPIPQGTRLNWIRLKDGVCTVNLSAEFLALPSHTEDAERLCLFSLVNTVGHAANAEQVRILIDGASVPGFTHYDLTQAIQPELFD